MCVVRHGVNHIDLSVMLFELHVLNSYTLNSKEKL